MPIEYGKPGGVLRERAEVRGSVGVFDVSPLGKAAGTGPGAAAFVNAVLANDLARIEPGQAQYTMCCTDTGGVVEDLRQYLRSEGGVFPIPNSTHNPRVGRHRPGAAPGGIPGADILHSNGGVSG